MSTGYMKVHLTSADEALPIAGATVMIKDKAGKTLYTLVTNENGETEKVALECPPKENNESPLRPGPHAGDYDVFVPVHKRQKQVTVHGVHVMDGLTTVLPVNMEPQEEGVSPEQNRLDYYIPEKFGVELQKASGSANVSPGGVSTAAPSNFNGYPSDFGISRAISANEVPVPEYIVVHLGSPNASARNVRVNFKEYLKNVASHEIYATWEVAALYANIYSQISFALNRFYTVWYRSRGRDFDITNNTAYDQYYVDGGGYFENLGRIVDEVFNHFLRVPGRREPYFAQYCNGTTATCNGLSQWGSQALAQRGYNPSQIVRHYFPSSIDIVESTNFVNAIYRAYPGTALREGSTGENVLLMQTFLNRISGNFYIPNVGRPDGVFGPSTTASVKAFQQVFNLAADGVIGRGTWYEIIRVFVAVTGLAELISEGENIGIGTTPPTTVLTLNSRGGDVAKLQFLINFISEFYPYSQYVVQDSVYRQSTQEAVRMIQRENNLVADGITGPTTWRKLYDLYWSIVDSGIVPRPPTEPPVEPERPPFPGTLLRLGSRGSDVSLMQQYLNRIARYYPAIGTLSTDGVFGPATDASVRTFQRLFGLTADGIIGRMTWDRIVDVYNNLPATPPPAYPGTVLRQGSSGNNVRTLQTHLNTIAAAYPTIPKLTADGVFGSGTAAAVRAFQQRFGLTADGIVGPQTWNMIMSVHSLVTTNP